MNIHNNSTNNKVTLDEIFSPRGIAIIGASAKKIGFAEFVIYSLQKVNFPAIYPVNPNYEELSGLKCYPSLLDIPGEVDHVIVNIPAEKALKLLDDCAAKKVKSVQFFTAGFGESGDTKRAQLEHDMLIKAKAAGFRIIGPNCVGLFVPKSRVVNSFNVPMEPGPIGFISQSGGHAHNLPVYGSQRGLRFSKVVSYGNALDVNECDLLEYFCDDEETEIIAAYIEGIKDGSRFVKILEKTAAKKPVVLYKGGRTEAGKRAVHGHTASIANSVEIIDALCRQMNVIQVDDIEEMIDVLTILKFVKPFPQGTGVAMLGAGGGPSVLASDEMEKEGLLLPVLTSEVQAQLKEKLPLAGSILINPLDTLNLIEPDVISMTMNVMGRVPDVHMFVYHLGFHPISTWGLGRFSSDKFLKSIINVMDEIKHSMSKPVILTLRPPLDLDGMTEFLEVQKAFVNEGFPVFHSMRFFARAMSRVIRWARGNALRES